MKKIYDAARDVWYACAHTAGVLIKTKLLWNWDTWIRFWLTSEQEKKITAGTRTFYVRGNSLFAKLTDMYVILENVYDKAYASGAHFSPDAIVVDVGAHIGGFSLYAGECASRGIVYAVEPFPDNFRLLEKNISLNHMNNVIPVGRALSSHGGTVDFYVDGINTSAHSLTKKSGNKILVPCMTLKDFFETYGIQTCDFLKMDCEGGEYDIILGAPVEVLKKITRMVMEYHVPEYFGLDNNGLLQDMTHALTEAGFHVSVERENYKRGYIRASRA